MNGEERAMKLKKFFESFEMMRKYQKLYFKNRMQSDLQKAKGYEAVCDKLYTEISSKQDALL
jgi:hypothetical protein